VKGNKEVEQPKKATRMCAVEGYNPVVGKHVEVFHDEQWKMGKELKEEFYEIGRMIEHGEGFNVQVTNKLLACQKHLVFEDIIGQANRMKCREHWCDIKHAIAFGEKKEVAEHYERLMYCVFMQDCTDVLPNGELCVRGKAAKEPAAMNYVSYESQGERHGYNECVGFEERQRPRSSGSDASDARGTGMSRNLHSANYSNARPAWATSRNDARNGERVNSEYGRQRTLSRDGIVDEENVRADEQRQRRYSGVRGERLPSSSSQGRYYSCGNQSVWVPSTWGESFQYPFPSCNCHNGRLIARCFVTQKVNANNGRYFFRCGCFGAKECDFFEFVDEWERNIGNQM
jgi:hypothetical protein